MMCVVVSPISPIPPPMLAERIGASIKAARKAKGWSLEKLAAKVEPKTSYQQLARLEKGDRTLSVQWVERIAKALGCEPIDLIAGETASPQQFTLDEQVANEVARILAMAALQGEEPEPGIVQVLSLMLQELTATFSAHPQAYRDPAVARPVVGLVGRRYGPAAN